jgi:uncharacterized BrkB/YihY/UPF0761 family membrane protein
VVGHCGFALERWDSSRHRSRVAQLFSLGIMHTPLDKFKKADRDLKKSAIVCLLLGLLLIGGILFAYLKHYFSNLWDKQLPVNVYKPYIKAWVLTFGWLLPSLGIVLVLVAFQILSYRRKRDAVKEHDKIDA